MNTRNHHFISQWGLSHAVNDIYWFVLPSILPLLLEQFGLSYKSAGVILTLYLGAIALFSFIFGKLTDSLSPFTLIGGGFLIASLGFFFLGWAGNMFTFILFLFVAALGVSTYHPAAYTLVSGSSVDNHKGAQLGNFEFWGALGIFIMFFLYGVLLQKISWRGILYATAFPGIIVGCLFLKVFSEPEREKQGYPSLPQVDFHLSLTAQILFFLALALRILSITAIVNFAPTYLVKERAFSPSSANLVTGVLFLGGMLATLSLGRLVDRFPPFPFILWISAFTIPLIWSLSYVQNAFLLMILFFLLGGCWLGFMPAQNYILSSFSPSQGKGKIFGLMMATTTLTNAFAPGLFGLVADWIGISSSIKFFSLFVALSFLIFLFLSSPFSLQRHP